MASTAQHTEQPQPALPLQSLSLPFKTRFALKFLTFITDTVRRNNGTVNRRLFNLLDRHIPANPNPINAVSTHDITVNSTTNLWFRLFIPHRQPPPSKLPVIVFFHGGGFVFLSAASAVYDAACRRFSGELNAVVCSVEYRLAPEHKLPAPYDDGADILTFLDQNRHKITDWPGNADVSRCFVAGDSAGGNISHHVVAKALSESERFRDVKVIGLINIQPFFGGSDKVDSEAALEGAPIVSAARSAWMWKAVLPVGMDKDHRAVNVSGPNAMELRGFDFPETLVFIGGFDPLKDWQRRYYEWLRKCGVVVKLVEYSDAIHGFYLFRELPQASLLFAEVQEFVGKQMSKVVN